MKVRFKKYDALLALSKFKPHPKNRNTHPEEQIKRLAAIMKYQGVRAPITVSKRSGFITRGHGRLAAAKLNKWKEFPVVYQEYDSAEQEYADLQADNAIASWAELDLSAIRADIPGMKLDLDMLGIRDFKDLKTFEEECPEEFEKVDFDIKTKHTCPSCGYKFS